MPQHFCVRNSFLLFHCFFFILPLRCGLLLLLFCGGKCRFLLSLSLSLTHPASPNSSNNNTRHLNSEISRGGGICRRRRSELRGRGRRKRRGISVQCFYFMCVSVSAASALFSFLLPSSGSWQIFSELNEVRPRRNPKK